MNSIQIIRPALWFLISAGFALALNAAEIELQREVACQGSLVRLGEVAEIVSEDTLQQKRLAEVELFPAPATDGWIEVDQRDLLELLEIRGIDPLEIRLTGAPRVVVYGPSTIMPSVEPAALPMNQAAAAPRRLHPKPIDTHAAYPARVADPELIATAQMRVAQGIVDYLHRAAGGSYDWEVAPQVGSRQAAMLASGGLEITGGQEPWVGSQTFHVRVHRAGGIAEQTVVAEVSLPTKVVATTRNLSAGDVIQATDLQLIVPAGRFADRPTLRKIEAAVGMEVIRNVVAGQPIENDMLCKPILVKRNAVAQLNVRAGGVVVGTKVRAMDDGSHGDLVRVQSLFDRQQFTATVIGPQQLEMLTGSGGN